MPSSNQPLQTMAPGLALQPTVPWSVIFNSSSVDNSGTTVTDPYATAQLAAAQLSSIETGGRVLWTQYGSGRVEFLPLFTSAGANCKFTPWGFDARPTTVVRSVSNTPSTCVRPDASDAFWLGIPYNLANDGAVDEVLVTARGNTTKLTIPTCNLPNGDAMFTGSGKPIALPDQTSGTSYYFGARQIFDRAGIYATAVTVSTISAGTLVILARII